MRCGRLGSTDEEMSAISPGSGSEDAIRAPELRALPDAPASANPVESAFGYTLQEQSLDVLIGHNQNRGVGSNLNAFTERPEPQRVGRRHDIIDGKHYPSFVADCRQDVDCLLIFSPWARSAIVGPRRSEQF